MTDRVYKECTLKTLYDTPTGYMVPNSEKFKVFPLRSGTWKAHPFSLVLFNILLEVLARAIRQDKEITGIQIGKKGEKLSLFADNTILYKENLKELVKKKNSWN